MVNVLTHHLIPILRLSFQGNMVPCRRGGWNPGGEVAGGGGTGPAAAELIGVVHSVRTNKQHTTFTEVTVEQPAKSQAVRWVFDNLKIQTKTDHLN